jgi:hypothetical protein
MNEAPDPLEAELSALRPQEVSPQLRQRVAESLADLQPAKLRRVWWLALVGGLAAACLAGILLWRESRRVEPEPMVVQPPPAPPPHVEDAEPTLLAYERALSRSPEELDALLNKPAMAGPEAHPEVARIGAFNRADATLHALIGDD